MKYIAIALFSLLMATHAFAKSTLIAMMKNSHAERANKSVFCDGC